MTEALAHSTGANNVTSNDALTGTADANATVTLTEGSTVLGSTTANASGVWAFTPTGLAQGAQTITASETNAAGLTGSSSLTFTYDTTAPTVTEALAHSTGANNVTSNDALTGTADANATVTLSEGSTVLGSTTANASGVWAFTPTGLAQGSQTITASETNAAGLTGSSSLTFTYDTVAPAAPVITADAVNGNNSVALSGTAGPNTTVTVYDAQTVLGTTTTNASGAWSFTTGTLPSGSQTLTATATDAAGNTSAASNAIDPIIASASAPTVTSKSITVTGNAQTISTLTAGETAVVTLGLSSAVTVSGGVPTLTLNDGGTAIYDASLSTATALAFDYTVAAGENANALAVTGVNLNGAAVADAFGNAANLSGADTTFSPISVKTTATLQTTSAASVANETATWTYSAAGALQEVVYTGITGQKYTTTDLVYGANNTPASEVWSNGSTVVQTETWNANGTVNNVHYYGFTGAYTDYDVSYGANNKPVERDLFQRHDRDLDLQQRQHAGGDRHPGHHRPEVHDNRPGLRRQQHAGERGVEQRLDRGPDRDLECQRHRQQRPLLRHHRSPTPTTTWSTAPTTSRSLATYSNGMTETWTYNSDNTLAEVVTQGITGQKYTTTDLVYGANNTPASEVWSNGSTVVQTETWNANGTINNVHYYGFTGRLHRLRRRLRRQQQAGAARPIPTA